MGAREKLSPTKAKHITNELKTLIKNEIEL